MEDYMNLLRFSCLSANVLHRIWTADRVGSPIEYDVMYREKVENYRRRHFPNLFGDQDRVVIPYTLPRHQSYQVPEEVGLTLELAGYVVVDYGAGKCCRQIKYPLVQSGKLPIEQCENIGAVLNKLHQMEAKETRKEFTDKMKSEPDEYERENLEILLRAKETELDKIWQQRKNIFNNDPARNSRSLATTGAVIVISRDPHDIAQMSYNKSWSSCFTLGRGKNCKKMWQELEEGGFVAYLVKQDDQQDLSKAIARVWIRRVEDSRGNEWAMPEERVYGQSPDNNHFHKLVTLWIKQKQGGLPIGNYQFYGAPYSDTYSLKDPEGNDPSAYEKEGDQYGAMTSNKDFETEIPSNDLKSLVGIIKKDPLKLLDSYVWEGLSDKFNLALDQLDTELPNYTKPAQESYNRLQDGLSKAFLRATYIENISLQEIINLNRKLDDEMSTTLLGSGVQSVRSMLLNKAINDLLARLKGSADTSGFASVASEFGAEALQPILKTPEFRWASHKITRKWLDWLDRTNHSSNTDYKAIRSEVYAFPEFDNIKSLTFKEALKKVADTSSFYFVNAIKFCKYLVESMQDQGLKSQYESELAAAAEASLDKYISEGFSRYINDPGKFVGLFYDFPFERLTELFSNRNFISIKLNSIFRDMILQDWNPGQPYTGTGEQMRQAYLWINNIASLLWKFPIAYEAEDLPQLIQEKAQALANAIKENANPDVTMNNLRNVVKNISERKLMIETPERMQAIRTRRWG